MSLLITVAVSILGSLFGLLIFKSWFNHLTLYCIIWGGLIFMYELKLLPYPDVSIQTWLFIISAFLSFLFGVLTIETARKSYPEISVQNQNSDTFLNIFADNGLVLKIVILFFGTISLFAAIQNWSVLIKIFGSIPAVFLNAKQIYFMNTHGGVKGVIPFISATGYVAVFFSAIYAAYKKKFSTITFYPFIGIIIKELATVGRAGMLFALMEFLFTFILFRKILKNDFNRRFKFSKSNAIISLVILLILMIVSATIVRITRTAKEDYTGASTELRQLEDNVIISPSLYLYLSSDIGVFNQYLYMENETAEFGENTFMPVYFLLAKLGAVERPHDFQKGYFIPMWTNTGTYIRELHADFGVSGIFLGPYVLGLLLTWLWYKFIREKNLIVLAILIHFYLIVGFSFLVMITRLPNWFFSLFTIIMCIPIITKLAMFSSNRSSLISNSKI